MDRNLLYNSENLYNRKVSVRIPKILFGDTESWFCGVPNCDFSSTFSIFRNSNFQIREPTFLRFGHLLFRIQTSTFLIFCGESSFWHEKKLFWPLFEIVNDAFESLEFMFRKFGCPNARNLSDWIPKTGSSNTGWPNWVPNASFSEYTNFMKLKIPKILI